MHIPATDKDSKGMIGMHRRIGTFGIMAVFCLALVACNPGQDTDDSSESVAPKGTVTAPATPSQDGNASQNGSFKPRFDGLYYTPKSDDTGHRHFVRYFKNGMVCKTFGAADASPDALRSSLKPTDASGELNCNAKFDASGSFTTTRPEGKVDYKLADPNDDSTAFDLHPTSHIPGFEGLRSVKHFEFSQD